MFVFNLHYRMSSKKNIARISFVWCLFLFLPPSIFFSGLLSMFSQKDVFSAKILSPTPLLPPVPEQLSSQWLVCHCENILYKAFAEITYRERALPFHRPFLHLFILLGLAFSFYVFFFLPPSVHLCKTIHFWFFC